MAFAAAITSSLHGGWKMAGGPERAGGPQPDGAGSSIALVLTHLVGLLLRGGAGTSKALAPCRRKDVHNEVKNPEGFRAALRQVVEAVSLLGFCASQWSYTKEGFSPG